MSPPLVLRAGPTGALFAGVPGDTLVCIGGALWAPQGAVSSARFTPTFASSNADAAIGNGDIAGSFSRNGKILHVETSLVWGTTSTVGTGALLVPLPPGYTVANVDPLGLVNTPAAPSTVGYGFQVLAGVDKASPVVAILFGGDLVLGLDPVMSAALAPGDAFGWALNIPLL